MKQTKRSIKGGVKGTLKSPFRLPAKFQDLAIKMSGVKSMTYLESPSRKLFLIGEKHGQPECREKGFVPITDIIMNYLHTTPHVDFMLEIDNETINFYREADFAEAPDIIQRLRVQVAPYIPTSTAPERPGLLSRVHWLDGILPKLAFGTPVDEDDEHVILLLGQIMDDEDPDPTIVSTVFELLYKKADTLMRAAIQRVEHSPAGDSYISTIGTAAMRRFVKHVTVLILRTYKFSKCATFKSLESYVDAFMTVYLPKVKSPYGLLFFMHRFSMDLYTCCRLLKEDPIWYKHVVIYAGNSHIRSLQLILEAAGFHSHSLNMGFNAECN